MLLNSSVRLSRIPSAALESSQPPFVTKAMTPRSLMRSEAHLIARIYESKRLIFSLAVERAA